MKSVKGKTKILYEIKNSKFYAFLYKVDSLEQIKNILKDLKKEYKDANHYCYAYILDGYQKCSDDGEPNGTAGMPMLNVLKQKDLNHTLCVVIRYFGGIKLGAGGLVRAYSKATSLVFDKSTIVESTLGYKIQIEFSYEKIKQVDYIIKDYLLTYKEYDENVIYELEVEKKKLDFLLKELEPFLISHTILKECYL